MKVKINENVRKVNCCEEYVNSYVNDQRIQNINMNSLTNDEKYILSLINNKRPSIIDVNFENVIDLLYEHRLLNVFYSTIIEDKLFEPYKKRVNVIYNINKMKINIYYELLQKLFSEINYQNIKCCLYKGIALELLTYNKNYIRMYDDIDIALENDTDILKLAKLIKDNFNVISDDFDAINEGVGEYKILIEYKSFKYVIEIKNKFNSNLIKDFDGKIKINIGNTFFETFSYEVTVNILINYIYYFSENIISLQYSNRMLLCYMYDLYHLLLNKQVDIDKVIEVARREKILHKFRVVFRRLKDIFPNNTTVYYNNKVRNEIIDYDHYGILDYGSIRWEINTLERYFHKNEISKNIVENQYDEFLLGDCNQSIFEGKGVLLSLSNENIKYNIFYESEKIKLKIFDITNILINKYALYITLFCYDAKNKFISPFFPIFITNVYNKCEAYKYIISRNSKDFILENLEKCRKFSENEVRISENKNSIEILIDCTKLNICTKKKIGISFFLHELDNYSTLSTRCHLAKTYHDLPLLIKLENQ